MQRLTLVSYAVASALVAPLGASASPFNRPTRRDPAVIPGYGFTGCYTEATNGRALTGSAFFDDQLTAEKCATACSGYKYFGLEYGRECYCGDSINEGSVEAAAEECSFSCPGNSAQTCGAGNRLTLYTRSGDATAPTLPSTYRALGCHSEPASSRALSAKVTRADDMTVQKCADVCHSSGFPVFGVEYYNECYCGNGLTPGSVPAPETDCSFPCAGNANEMCGGDWRINVYKFSTDASPPTSTAPSTPSPTVPSVDGWTGEGCYTEADGQRALSDVAFYDDFMTLEKCANVCGGYNWFGVEYGRECYCGNTLNEGSVPTAAAECSFPCPGKLSQTCGAGNRLNLYSFDDLDCSGDEDEDDGVPTSSVASVAVPSATSAPAITTTSAPELSETTTSTATSAPATTTTASPIINLLANGDFEGNPNTWEVYKYPTSQFDYDMATTDAAHSGESSAALRYAISFGPNVNHFTISSTQAMTLVPGATYNLSAWYKSSAINNYQCYVQFSVDGIASIPGSAPYALQTRISSARTGSTTDWTQVTNTWTNTPNYEANVILRIQSRCSIAGSVAGSAPFYSIYLDDVVFARQA
ncbi:WSC domain-containing protein [Cladorrhinum sp. PSN332]|nr:WSC domain-containing protein [Cladorrhinum sp. PSN332]